MERAGIDLPYKDEGTTIIIFAASNHSKKKSAFSNQSDPPAYDTGKLSAKLSKFALKATNKDSGSERIGPDSSEVTIKIPSGPPVLPDDLADRLEAATLDDKESAELDKRTNLLLNERLVRKECRDFLVGRLGGSGVKELENMLKDNSRRYSAKSAGNITVEEANLYGVGARQRLEQQLKTNLSDQDRRIAQSKLDDLDNNVRDFVKARAHGIIGEVNGKRIIFYNSFKKLTTVLHENLHLSTGLGDLGLASKLGLSDDGKVFAKPKDASLAISEALKKNKCTN